MSVNVKEDSNMVGTSSVIQVREGSETEFSRSVHSYMNAISGDPDIIYADLHSTKFPTKFVLIEMYRNAYARDRQAKTDYGTTWSGVKNGSMIESILVERIRPVLSLSPGYERPVYDYEDTDHINQHPIICRINPGCKPFGAFVRVFIHIEHEAVMLDILKNQGIAVARHEPGYLFADFYRFDTAGHFLVVEYYDDRESLSHHHTLPHTLEFAEMKAKAGYESAKHQAFTIRPITSLGPFARSYVTTKNTD